MYREGMMGCVDKWMMRIELPDRRRNLNRKFIDALNEDKQVFGVIEEHAYI